MVSFKCPQRQRFANRPRSLSSGSVAGNRHAGNIPVSTRPLAWFSIIHIIGHAVGIGADYTYLIFFAQILVCDAGRNDEYITFF